MILLNYAIQTHKSRFHDFWDNDAYEKLQDMIKMNAYTNIKLQSK